MKYEIHKNYVVMARRLSKIIYDESVLYPKNWAIDRWYEAIYLRDILNCYPNLKLGREIYLHQRNSQG